MRLRTMILGNDTTNEGLLLLHEGSEFWENDYVHCNDIVEKRVDAKRGDPMERLNNVRESRALIQGRWVRPLAPKIRIRLHLLLSASVWGGEWLAFGWSGIRSRDERHNCPNLSLPPSPDQILIIFDRIQSNILWRLLRVGTQRGNRQDSVWHSILQVSQNPM